MAINLESTLRSTISHGALSAGIALSLAAIADEASAQQPRGQGGNVVLDTVDVEAQTAPVEGEGAYAVQSASSPKQTAPLLNTPQTVTVVPQAIIQERGARNLTEVLRNTPGITFDAGENGFATSTNNFKLRGFDSSGSIFIDGARDNGSYGRDTFNIERVEVFKGPAADNGRGSTGGYINMVTKSPILQNFIAGEVGFGFDEYDSKLRKRGTVDVNYMVTPTVAVRFNGMWEGGGVAGREIAEANAYGLAPSIAFGLGTDFRAIFSYERLKRDDRPDWGVPGATLRGFFTYDPLAARASRDNYYGLRSDFDDVTADSAIARFEYDISPNTTISNQTRWSRVDRTARYTVPTGFTAPDTATAQIQAYDRLNNTITNQTNISTQFFTGTFKHNVSAGIEFTRETSDALRFTTVNNNTNIFDPDPGRPAATLPTATQTNDVKINTVAAYLYDTIELNRHWQITGGLRVERYKVEIDSKQVDGTPILFDGASLSETTLGGKIGIVYKPVENSSYYASFGISHLAPGAYLSNPDISREGDNAFPGFLPDAKPVQMHNYEIGAKWDLLDKRLQAGVALFRSEKHNVPVVGALTGPVLGYHELIIQGIEFSLAGHLTDRWKVFGGLLLMNSERKISAALNAARRDFNNQARGDYGCPNLPVPCDVTVDGDELAFTPKVSANLWTTYRFDNKWTLGGGVQYVGSSYFGRPDDATRFVKNGRWGKLPGYFLAHFMASYEVRKDVNIVFNVDNIFDKTYAVSANWAASRATLGAPRTYRVSANFKY